MDIKDFVSNYHTHPILFIGTGISMRYLQKSYSWKSLLEQITVDLAGNDEQYLNIDSHFNGNCPTMVSEIEMFAHDFDYQDIAKYVIERYSSDGILS